VINDASNIVYTTGLFSKKAKAKYRIQANSIYRVIGHSGIPLLAEDCGLNIDEGTDEDKGTTTIDSDNNDASNIESTYGSISAQEKGHGQVEDPTKQ